MLSSQLPKLRTTLTSSSSHALSSTLYRPFTSSSSSSNSKSKPSSSSSTQQEEATERPPINYISLKTLYPFLLLSIMTSLALNLSHNRSKFNELELNFKARISVLERIITRLRLARILNENDKGKGKELNEEEQEIIERELELVGLGRGKGKGTSEEEVVIGTSWKEVFLGKKGKEWEEPDEVDWEKVFKEADEKDKKNQLLSKQKSTPEISQDSEPNESEIIPVVPKSIPIVKVKPTSASQFL